MRGRRQYARKGRRHGKGAIWLLSLGLPMFASAMPLDQAVRAGLAIHPEVRSAMAEADRAGTEVEMAKGGYYPSVTMSGGPQEFDFGEIVYDLTASQMLYDWGRVTSKVDSASATQRKLSEAVLVARDDAALDIVETYLDVLASERRVEVVREHIQRLDGIREMTQARGGDGYADRSELDRANLELSRAQEQLSLEKGNLQDARNQYAILVGQEPADLVEPEPMSLQRYLAASDMARVIRESPLQRKALEDANVAEAEVREAKASLLPQLNLEASALRREIGGHPESDSVVSLRFRMDTFQGLSNFRRPADRRAAAPGIGEMERRRDAARHPPATAEPLRQRRHAALAGTVADPAGDRVGAGRRVVSRTVRGWPARRDRPAQRAARAVRGRAATDQPADRTQAHRVSGGRASRPVGSAIGEPAESWKLRKPRITS